MMKNIRSDDVRKKAITAALKKKTSCSKVTNLKEIRFTGRSRQPDEHYFEGRFLARVRGGWEFKCLARITAEDMGEDLDSDPAVGK